MATNAKVGNTRPAPTKLSRITYASSIVPKSISRVRQDVGKWNTALNMARKEKDAKQYLLQLLLDEIGNDAHLTSQVGNRINKSLAQAFMLTDKAGTPNQELTALLQNKKWVNDINKAILESKLFGYSVTEFDWIKIADEDTLQVTLLDRTNIEPVAGLFFPDYTDDKNVKYRETKEYGTWVLEFGDKKDLGLLNKAVPHVLFKRFAQSCWSELCEIAGTPMRVLKTNTSDAGAVRRGERMMRDMGAAAWAVIDDNENFEWVSANNTNGDIYKSLMTYCDGQLSLLICGAIIGQDTQNGSRSKDESAQNVLQDLVDADLSFIEQCWNDIVIPALQNLGVLSGECIYKYPKAEDLEMLWKIVQGAMSSLDVDIDWFNETFGVKFTAKKAAPGNEPEGQKKLSYEPSFFT